MKIVALSSTIYPKDFVTSTTLRDDRLEEVARCMYELEEQIGQTSSIIRREEPVPPALFKDTEFLSAEQKRKVLSNWDGFIKNGYSWSCFTDRIYKHLSLHCGYIAHYNRIGFYQTYWREDIPEFARKNNLLVRPAPSAFYNWIAFLAQFTIWGDYRDINTAMMYSLRSKLISFRKELENEVVTLFQSEIRYRHQLSREKKEHIQRRIGELTSKLEELNTELTHMNPDTFIDKRVHHYKALFPSMSEESFAVKGLAGNLF